jgi:hypothetical protein
MIYKDLALRKFTAFYTDRFSVCPNINANFRDIAIFKNVVKQNNDSNKICRYVRGLLLYQTSFL